MIKKLILFIAFFSFMHANAQDYLGIRQSNYSGINGFDINPASIADSRFKFDMNVIGGGFMFYNNYLGISRANIFTAINGEAGNNFFEQEVNVRETDFSKSAMVTNEIMMPSFMVSLSDQSALAFSWRIRTFVNIDGIDPPLAQLMIEDFDYSDLHLERLENEKLSIQAMTWAEYGAGYARVLMDDNEHFMKAGGRIKLLQGVYAGYMHAENLEYEFQNEDTVSIFVSDINYGHSEGFDPFNFDQTEFKFDGRPGLGLDLGFVYEWRPDWKDYKYEMDGRDNLWRKDKNKYKLKVGFSVNDIGRIRYKKGYRSGDFRADVNAWDFRNIAATSIEDLDDTLFNRFERLPNDEEYFKMNLPTSISLQVDYNVWQDFYVNLTTFWTFKFSRDVNKVHHFTNYSITPRYDFKFGTIAVPLSLSQYTGFRAGLGMRVTPWLFVGTSDVRSVFSNSNLQGADIYFSTKIPIFYKHPKDKDQDKVSNEHDECPEIAGVWAFKGCPDSDGDLIPDSEDECPAEAGLLEFNGCPDTDRDGIMDKEDDCPQTPGLKEFNGCPDTDGDGIKDSEDECKTLAGVKEFNGCPDTDGDGIKDSEDDCPEEAGPERNFGCPELVRLHLVDRMGNIIATAAIDDSSQFIFKNLPVDRTYLFLLDGVDPNISEKISVILRNKDGDHEIIAQMEESGFFVYRHIESEKEELALMEEEDPDLEVQLNEEEEEILKKAFDNLEFATGKSIIKNESFESLDELMELLKKKPEWKISIEGHTDNVGSASNNLILSKKRAEAVKFYLTSRGIDTERIITKFYGETQPIADNDTEEGRQTNRRVEMTIVE